MKTTPKVWGWTLDALSTAIVLLGGIALGTGLFDLRLPGVWFPHLVQLRWYCVGAIAIVLGLWALAASGEARNEGGSWPLALRRAGWAFLPSLVILPFLWKPLHPFRQALPWPFVAALTVSLAISLPSGRALARWRGWDETGRWEMPVLAVAALIYLACFAFLAIGRHDSFRTHALDMGTLDQAVWNTSQGRILEMTELALPLDAHPQTISRLAGGKMEVILIPISALYWLLPDPRLLLGLQVLLAAAGGWLVYDLGRARLGSGAALAMAMAYYLFLPLHYAIMAEFHTLTLSVPFLLLAFWGLVRRRWACYHLGSLLALSCRIDLMPLVLLLGLYALVTIRPKRHGVITIAIALAWLAIDVGLVVPYLGKIYHDAGSRQLLLERYGHLGTSAGEVILGLLRDPSRALATALTPGKFEAIIFLFLPLGFLSVLSPAALAIALPTLAVNLLSASPYQGSIEAHYMAPLVPVLFFSSVVGLRWLDGSVRNRRAWMGAIAVWLVLFGFLVDFAYSPFPPGRRFDPLAFRHLTSHEEALEAMVDEIPGGAVVSAQSDLFPHLSQRQRIYLFPFVEDAWFIALDLNASSEMAPLEIHAFYQEVDRLLSDEDWGAILFRDGALLLERGADGSDREKLRAQVEDYRSNFYRVKFHGYRGPDALETDRLYRVRVTLENAGSQGWSSEGKYPVFLSYHWWAPDGRLLKRDGNRTYFTHVIAPGERLEVVASLHTPEEQGDYVLEWDLVQEWDSWFKEKGLSRTLRVPVRVRVP